MKGMKSRMAEEKNTLSTTTSENVSDVTLTSNSVVANLREAYVIAKTLCQAEIIPDAYKNKPADCMIAVDMANRMGVSPLMVMQSLYVVKGKPSWSGQACMSFIQANPNFTDVRPVYVENQNTGGKGCYISAKRTSDGSVVNGVTVTMAMAKAEGWTKNPKWQNMPDLMLAYRASAFFARVYCPSVLMGVSVEGEIEDITTKSEKGAKKIL
ncbi:MAG: recombinase RecT [Ruminococcus sp.]|nr:recombinase RecT [Ruminococcus sp.]MDE6679200.1 recombinase RecT [Ruminococcus sp.]